MIECRILGPVEVVLDGEHHVPAGPIQRGLLTALAMNIDRSLSTSVLTEALWGDPPKYARENLRGYLSKLRRLFESIQAGGSMLINNHHGAGLCLSSEGVEVDFSEFTRLAKAVPTELSRARLSSALAHGQRALRLWRGPFGEGLPMTPWFHNHNLRLDDLRTRLVHDLLAVRLLVGDHGGLLHEIETGLEEAYRQERLWILLGCAHYLTGDAPSALDTIKRCQAYFVTEYGLDLPNSMRKLQHAILERRTDRVRDLVSVKSV